MSESQKRKEILEEWRGEVSERVQRAVALKESGLTNAEIAEKFGVKESTVRHILRLHSAEASMTSSDESGVIL